MRFITELKYRLYEVLGEVLGFVLMVLISFLPFGLIAFAIYVGSDILNLLNNMCTYLFMVQVSLGFLFIFKKIFSKNNDINIAILV